MSQEIKDRALPLIMLVVMKRNGGIKSRGLKFISPKIYTDEYERALPTPGFYFLKFVCDVATK